MIKLGQKEFFWFSGFMVFCSLMFLFLSVTSYADSGDDLTDQIQDSGYVLDSGVPGDYANDVHALRENSDLLLYGLIPLVIAVFLIWKGCRWFSETFSDPFL